MPDQPQHHPPRLAAWLLAHLLPDHEGHTPLGDFEEYFRRLCRQEGGRRARRWYWHQVLGLIPRRLYNTFYWGLRMLRNYLRSALRAIRPQKSYTVLNISGLAVGMVCCLLILHYVRDELTHDRHHPHSDRTYRVAMEIGEPKGSTAYAAVPRPVALVLPRDYPMVEAAVRLTDLKPTPVVTHRDKQFNEPRFFLADSTFFDFFSAPLVLGHPKTALTEPNTMVITEAMAEKYFGHENPLGKTLTVRVAPTWRVNFTERDFTVTGVTPGLPGNSHFQFDFLASFATMQGHFEDQWWGGLTFTYIRLREDANPAALEAQFPAMLRRYLGAYLEENGDSYDAWLEKRGGFRYYLQSLTDLHFFSKTAWEIGPGGNRGNVYLLGLIAAFILLLACINYVNLATARSMHRAREVGVRKVLGSYRGQLVAQFMLEAVLQTGLALGVALGLMALALPSFNVLTGRSFQWTALWDAGWVTGLIGFVLLVSVLAGGYPAFYLSRFNPTTVLKGHTGLHPGRRFRMRNGLVAFQFVVCITLLIATAVVYSQMTYVQSKPLGYEQENVVVIRNAQVLGAQAEAFGQALQSQPAVRHVSASFSVPGSDLDDPFEYIALDSSWDGDPVRLYPSLVDYGYVETLGFRLLSGRAFDRRYGADSMAVLLNESAVRAFGWDEATGKHIRTQAGDYTVTMPVIGVVKDFHFASLHEPIKPMALVMREGYPWMREQPYSHVIVRAGPGEVSETIDALEALWTSFVPDRPFDFTFLDQRLDNLYREDRQAGRLFAVFAAFALLISCLGLFGLAAFTTEQRTKEIGVRKVLGASTLRIVALLLGQLLRLVGLGFVVAVPLAYLAMDRWLADFAYRIELSVWIFLMAGLFALLIAFFTVGYQSIKASLANPARSLRYE